MNQHQSLFSRIEKNIREKLPIQNPLQTFVHNNILMMFEAKKFHHALREASFYYQGRPYREEDFFIENFKSGRITEHDIDQVYDSYFSTYGDITPPQGLDKEFHFYKRILLADHLRVHPRKILTITDQDLWSKAYSLFPNENEEFDFNYIKSLRLKSFWRENYDESLEQYGHPFIIRMLSSFLDQGMSFWPNPFVKKGLWSFFLFNLEQTSHLDADWIKSLNKKVSKYLEDGLSFSQIIDKEVESRGIASESKENYILEILFDLKGWSGMINKLEMEPSQAPLRSPKVSLEEYTAILLLVEGTLNEYLSQKYSLDLYTLYNQSHKIVISKMECALLIYEMSKLTSDAQIWVSQLDLKAAREALELLMIFNRHHRLPLWQEAYEYHFYQDSLNALHSHQKNDRSIPQDPKYQLCFCIDDREESIRRHIEEVSPESVTYGVVGFFNVDMKFSGINQRRLIAQCPPVINPRKIVREVCHTHSNENDSFQKTHDDWGRSLLSVYYNSRTLFRGFFVSLILGIASFIPLTMKVLMPKTASSLRKKALNLIRPTPKTKLLLDKVSSTEGYSKDEMAEIVKSIFDICGFKNKFSSFVVMVAHGASSSNNPFKQAYGCGACGGNQGFPNGRAFATMANDLEVRKILKLKGVNIPDQTYIQAAFHDTTTDEISFLDEELTPQEFKGDLIYLKKVFLEAGERTAWERSQRFNSTAAKKNQKSAFMHVKERAEDLAQPRPEYGHNRVALAVIGKRELTKNLFLNHRSFLCTYDWETDDDGEILKQVMLGCVPVCVNINMDYYFSHVDNENYGSGSKLPLNVTSLLGVMTGAQSDLRIGLARQMVELHEPMRILVMIEAPRERVMNIIDNNPRLKKMVYNLWMKLAIKDPQTNETLLFDGKSFHTYHMESYRLPTFKNSQELIRKTSALVDFAQLTGGQ